MDVKSVIEEWEIDSKIDISNLGSEALRAVELHSKYIKKLCLVREAIRTLESKLEVLERERTEYYRGVSGEDNYDIKIMKQDIPKYLKSDKLIQPVLNKIRELKDLEEAIKSIMQCINSLGFQVNSAITWERFKNGLN